MHHPIKMALQPSLDLALLDLQRGIEDKIRVMIEVGGAEIADLDAYVARADEYSVMADSRKFPLLGETIEALAQRAGRIKQMVREHQAERRQALKELQDEAGM